MILKLHITAVLLSLLFSVPLEAQTKTVGIESNQKTHIVAAILSQTHQKDSLGETVYEIQGESQKDIPTVDGVFVPPSVIKMPKPKYPKSLKGRLAEEFVTAEGIVAQNGHFIDATVVESVDSDVKKCALDAVSRATFHPATLDGKPVATLVQFKIQFKIY